jgi:hypothetical protein
MMMIRRLVLCCFILFCPGFSWADNLAPEKNADQTINGKPDKDPDSIIGFNFENDLFAGRDQYYTNGARFSYLTPEYNAPQLARTVANYLPFSKGEPYRISLALGQNIYTPHDIRTSVPDPDDRPYAGWLYGSVGLVADRGNRLDTAMLTVGMVGPASLARQTQTIIHRWVDSPKPMGWDYQLKNEPGVMLTMERKWRHWVYYNPTGLGFDVMPEIGATVGNIQTYANTGAMLRVGYQLPDDYGPPRIRPSLPGSDFFIPEKKFGFYGFAGVEGRAVARDIFLDGNTFTDGPSVNKEYGVASLQAGIAATYGRYRVSYTQVFETKEFKTQQHSTEYGAVTLAIRF